MSRVAKKPLTAEEYKEAMERSQKIRYYIQRDEVPVYVIAAHVEKNPQTIYGWLRHGLTEEQYDLLYRSICTLSVLALADGGQRYER